METLNTGNMAGGEVMDNSVLERRWSEVKAHLDSLIAGENSYPRDTLMRLLGELTALCVVLDYAGEPRITWFSDLAFYEQLILKK